MATTKKTTAKTVETKAAPVEALENVVDAPKAEEKKAVKAPAKKTVKKVAKETVKKTVKSVKAAEEAVAKAAEEAVEKAVEKAAEKPAAKKPGRKPAAKKAELTASISVQFAGKSYTNEELVQIAKNVWQYDLKKEEKDLQSVELYVKPEESKVYYVFNGTEDGCFGI